MPTAWPIDRIPRRFLGPAAVAGVCLMFAAAVLPSLSRLDFFDGVEHFNLATVQEMRRDEAAGEVVNWLLPKLQDQPRIVKPPLAAWISSLLVRPADVTAISTPDDAAREEAISRFVLLCRLPTLVCACLLLVGVYVLGTALAAGDWRAGATSALICASTVLFFQQGRRATTDLQLALWVTWTNAFLTLWVYRERRWTGAIGAGIALGLASMAKGPHIALLMTLVPFGAWLLFARLFPNSKQREVPAQRSRNLLPVLLALILGVVVGGWWYLYVFKTVPDITEIWRREVLRKDAQIGRNKMSEDPWYAYTAVFGLLLPWTGFVVLGAVCVVREVLSHRTRRVPALADSDDAGSEVLRRPGSFPGNALTESGSSGYLRHRRGNDAQHLNSRTSQMALALCWLLLPILVMSIFPERKLRYLLPFAAPAAVLAGWAAIRWWDQRRNANDVASRRDCRFGIIAALVTIAAAAYLILHVSIAGTMGGKGYITVAGTPWLPMQRAAVLILAGACILFIGVRRSGRTLVAPLLAITLVAWLAGETRLSGQSASPGDPDDRPQRELAADIWHRWPNAIVYSADPVTLYGQLNLPAIVLSMHLNRVIEPRPATLPATPQDQPIVLMTDAIGDPPPIAPGWTRVATVPLRKGARYVDVLSK